VGSKLLLERQKGGDGWGRGVESSLYFEGHEAERGDGMGWGLSLSRAVLVGIGRRVTPKRRAPSPAAINDRDKVRYGLFSLVLSNLLPLCQHRILLSSLHSSELE